LIWTKYLTPNVIITTFELYTIFHLFAIKIRPKRENYSFDFLIKYIPILSNTKHAVIEKNVPAPIISNRPPEKINHHAQVSIDIIRSIGHIIVTMEKITS